MTDTALEVRAHHLPAVTSAPSAAEWQALRDQAAVICASGMAPRAINTEEKVLTVALKGRELRIPPMQALSHIHIVEGKPTLSSELMLALVQRAGHKIRVRETSAERAVVEGVRADDPDYPTTITWTMDDARRAGVAGKGPWKQYPDAMLRARAISALCRAMFADVLMGASYTPEELGVTVDADGQVLTDPRHDVLLQEVDELLDEVARAGIDVDAATARRYAGTSVEHAESAVRNLRSRLSEQVVDAEIVDDPEPEVDPLPAGSTSAPEPEPEVEAQPEIEAPHPDGWDVPEQTDTGDPFDWKAHAATTGVKTVDILKSLRDGWPDNSQWNKPNRSKDIDTLAADPVMADIVRAAIDDAKGA